MANCKSLSHSLEDYLEAILILETKNRVARVRDIAAHLDVQMPSVTGAVKSLREKGLVNYEKNSFISLTAEGKNTAEEIFNKHSVLVEFLEKVLYLSREKAVQQACSMEHFIDEETVARFSICSAFMQKLIKENEVISEKDWVRSLKEGI